MPNVLASVHQFASSSFSNISLLRFSPRAVGSIITLVRSLCAVCGSNVGEKREFHDMCTVSVKSQGKSWLELGSAHSRKLKQ